MKFSLPAFAFAVGLVCDCVPLVSGLPALSSTNVAPQVFEEHVETASGTAIQSLKRQAPNISLPISQNEFNPFAYDKTVQAAYENNNIAVNLGSPLEKPLIDMVAQGLTDDFKRRFDAAKTVYWNPVGANSFTLNCSVPLIVHRINLDFSLEVHIYPGAGTDLTWLAVQAAMQSVLKASTQLDNSLFTEYVLFSVDWVQNFYPWTQGTFDVQANPHPASFNNVIPNIDLANLPEPIDTSAPDVATSLDTLPVFPPLPLNSTSWNGGSSTGNGTAKPATGTVQTS